MRKVIYCVLCLTLIEVLIGASLVLFALVGSNESLARMLVLNVHLINSLLLVGAITVSFKSAKARFISWKTPHVYFLTAFILIALTGSIASLAGTLFPSHSLEEAFLLDISKNAHITTQLRVLHPVVAVLFALVFLFWTQTSKKSHRKDIQVALFAMGVVFAGAITLLSLSPPIMKLTHALLAYLLWISLIWISLNTRQENP